MQRDDSPLVRRCFIRLREANMQDRQLNELTALSLPAPKQKAIAAAPAIVYDPNYFRENLPQELLFEILDMLAPEDIVKLGQVEKFYGRTRRASALWNSETANYFWFRKCIRHFSDHLAAKYNADIYYFEEFKKTYLQQYEELSIKTRRLFSFTKEQDIFSLRNADFTLDDITKHDLSDQYLIEHVANKINCQLIFNRFYEIAQQDYTIKNNNIEIIDLTKKRWDKHVTFMSYVVLLSQVDEIEPLLIHGAKLEEECIKGFQPIHVGVSHGKLAVVKKIIELNPQMLDLPDAFGQTPLMLAARCNQSEILVYLIKRGAKLNEIYNNPQTQQDNGKTALYIAAELGYTDIVVMLAKAGADATIKPQAMKVCVIHLVAKLGNVQMMQALLKADPRLLNQPDDSQQTALLWAVSENKMDVVEHLLTYWRLNLNVIAVRGDNPLPQCNNLTALHGAILINLPAMVTVLVNAGAKLRTFNQKGDQPIHTAVQDGRIDIVKILLDKDDALVNEPNKQGFTPVMLAIDANEEMQELLLQYKPDLHLRNMVDATNAQAIHYAARRKNLSMVKRLVQVNPELVNADDAFGCTPIIIAAMGGNVDIVHYLATQQADIDKQTKDGEFIAIEFAAAENHLDAVLALMQYNANPRYTLHIAAGLGLLPIMKGLLNAKPEVLDKVDRNGNTALIFAVEKNKLEAFTELLAHRADVHVVNNAGESALHIAAKLGHSDMVIALLNQGAKVDPAKPLGKNSQLNAEAQAKLRLAEYMAVRPTQPKYKTAIKFLGWEWHYGYSEKKKMLAANAMSAHFFANKGGKVDLSGCQDEKERQKVKEAMKQGELKNIYKSLKAASG